MEENKQHIDELFRESLGNYTETPPPAVWDAIELRLGGEKRRPAGGFMRWWGWLALLLLAVGGGALVMNKYKKESKTIASQNTVPKTPVRHAPTAVTPPPDSSKTNTVAAKNTLDHADVDAPATVATSATNTSRHHSSHHSRVAHNAPQRGHGHNHNNISAATTTHDKTATASNLGTDVAPAVAKNHRRSNSSNNHSFNHNNINASSRPAHRTHTPEKQPVVTNVTEPQTATIDKPTTVPAKTAKRPRARHEPAIGSASKSVSNQQSHPSKTKAAANNNSAHQATVSQNSVSQMPAKRAAKHSTTAIAAPVVKRPVRVAKKAVQTDALPIAARPARPPKKQPVTAAAPLVASKPARRPTKPATVAIQPKTKPVAKTAKASAKTRTPRPSRTSTPPAVAAVKPVRQPRPTPTKPFRNRVAKAGPALRNTVAAANNNSRQPLTQSHTGPASLQGKNEDVRFPSARTPEPATIPKPATAPDISGNPISDDDADSTSGGEETPYTMNSHRKYTNGLGFSAGIAAGYSFGFSKPAPGEGVIAPYLQYSISDRISLRLTPTYRFGNVTSQAAGTGDFYRVNNTTVKDTLKADSAGGPVFHYYYLSQSYDSIKTSSSYGGKTWAVDLPITLSFRLGGGFSLFGGPVLSYQNTIALSTSQQVYNKILIDSVVHSFQPINPDTLKARFKHNGVPYSTFDDPGGSSSAAFRLGYTAGLRFNYQRWQAEASIQQDISGTSNITNATVQKIYTQPYLHFTIGYSLWEPRRRKVETP